MRFSDFFFFCGKLAGRKPTHDFLSLYSNSTAQQDPRPPSQGTPHFFFFFVNYCKKMIYCEFFSVMFLPCFSLTWDRGGVNVA